MRLSGAGVLLLGLLNNALAAAEAVAEPETRAVTVWAWPLDDSSPKQLAKVSYLVTPGGLISFPYNASVVDYTPPQNAPVDSESLVRVGLYDPKAPQPWSGIITAAGSFDAQLQHKLSLHTDHDGNVFHVGFTAYSKPVDKEREREAAREARKQSRAAVRSATQKSKSKPTSTPKAKANSKKKTAPVEIRDEPLLVDLIPVTPGPLPVLNKPVVLAQDGKAPDAQPEEKSFLQKYWWAIALFLVIQLVAGGGGQQEGGAAAGGGGGGSSK